jgi:hypothetical protein
MGGKPYAGRGSRRNNVAAIALRYPENGACAIGGEPMGLSGTLRIGSDANLAIAIGADGRNVEAPDVSSDGVIKGRN